MKRLIAVAAIAFAALATPTAAAPLNSALAEAVTAAAQELDLRQDARSRVRSHYRRGSVTSRGYRRGGYVRSHTRRR